MDDRDISGKHQPVDRKSELLQTALSLAIHHPRASARWYATLSENDLQTLSDGIGRLLENINHLISTLRGHVKDDDPELTRAMNDLQPLLDITRDIKKANGG